MTFIIADACVNFRNIEEAKQIIRKCAESGVDTVKFQAYKKGHPAPGHPRAQEIDAIVMTPEIAWELWQYCQVMDIEFMCTGMYPESISWLAPLLKRFKVRYADRSDGKLWSELQKYRGNKHVLVSVDQPIDHKLTVTKTLYCVPEYPPKNPPSAEFWMYDGFSSHYPQWQVPATIARTYGLEYLEVHVMLDEYADDWAPIDEAVSLKITDLKKLVKEVKG